MASRPRPISPPADILPFYPFVHYMKGFSNNNARIAASAAAFALASTRNNDGPGKGSKTHGGRKVKSKAKPRSKTTTKRKVKSKQHASGLGTSGSYVALTYKSPRNSPYEIVKKIGNDAQYLFNYTSSVTVGAGFQQPWMIATMMSQTELANMWAAASSFYNIIAPANPVQSLNTTGFKSNKFNLKRINLICEITNQSPALCNLEIYTCISKVTKPTYVSPQTDWTNGLVDEAGTATPVLITEVGNKPWGSKQFNMNWKVVKKHTVHLQGGQPHKYQFNFRPKRYMDEAYSTAFNQIRGLTVGVLVVAWGQIGDTNANYTVGNITSVPCKLIASLNKTYYYNMLDVFPRAYHSNGAALAQDPVPNVYIINEEAGNVLNVEDVVPNPVYA